MPTTKTVNFLPAVFQTETNKKFLNATLDQLVSEPNLVAINGYVGRKFSPGFESISSYLAESTTLRADYQLEPAVVVRNSVSDELEYAVTYQELLDKLNYYGANIANQDSLFKSDYYSYNPRINADTLINFGQYYWLPNGPSAVPVFAGDTQLQRTFYVYPNQSLQVYNLSGFGTTPNPDIVLSRGGNYQFKINQPGKKFYIQTAPGLSGINNLTNLSTREILGVENNGIDNGTLYFNVPNATAQDFYINMPVVQTVDLASPISYANIEGKLLSEIKSQFNGIDGQITNLNGKFLIFANYTTNPADWTVNNVTVPVNQRYGIWNIVLTPSGNDFIVNLAVYKTIPVNNKVIVLSGIQYGNTEWYTSIDNLLIRIPVITAPLSTLYYQDSEDPDQFGIIRIVESTRSYIDIDSEILGKTNYVSPNGVTFTNGLKIQFDSAVVPSSYANTEYYVENVGISIRLIPVNDLIVGYSGSNNSFEPSSYFTLYANGKLNAARDQLKIVSTNFPQTPNVSVGQFPNNINNRYIVVQDTKLTVPFRAGQNIPGEHEDIKFSNATIGISFPGIPFKAISNGAYIPTSDGTKWYYDTNKVNINGRDIYGGNVFDFGEYAYTNEDFISANAWANVSGFTDGYTSADGHSKLLGFALDGYPIYGPFGYRTATDRTSGVKRLSSGYIISDNYDNINRPANVSITLTTSIVDSSLITVSSTNGLNPGMKLTAVLVNGVPQTVPNRHIIDNALKTAVGLKPFLGDFTVLLNDNVTFSAGTILEFGFEAGAFIQDYIHKSMVNSGAVTDLDVYNGRFCVTPEFSDGTYAYFVTQTYPYIIGPQFFGSKIFDIDSSLSTPDYILINRASLDLNPWTRRNRWFHKSVLEATTNYTNIPQIFDPEARAKRPIVEFDSDLQLINFGKRSKNPVDLFDTQFSNPFLDVQGQYQGFFIDGVRLIEGMRVIFANDEDPLSKGKIYLIDFENIDDTGNKIKLVEAADAVVEADYSVSVLNGNRSKGLTYWYNGTVWILAQQKTSINQPPLFDVFDDEDVSYSDISKYPIINSESNFTGTKIFSYKTGNKEPDSILGLRLSYRNFNNVGDIEFYNDFDNQIFEYKVDSTNYRKKINSGFLHKNLPNGSKIKLNVWTNSRSQSRQMQNLSYSFDGINNEFTLDVKPVLSTTMPNFLVYINYKKLDSSFYQLYNISDDKILLVINPSQMTQGSRIDVLVYSDQISKFGFYQVPSNLNFNSQNQTLGAPTLGEMRNHIGALAQNDLNFLGDYPGVSNLRDLYIENQPGTILEQSAPVNYSMMFLCSDQYNLINSVNYACQEYTRFKNKFLNLASELKNVNQSNIISSVDAIIKKINIIKDKTFPWYYSGMAPYGDNKSIIRYNIFNPNQRNYELSTVYDPTELNNRAVLIYLNGQQLLLGKDYEFLTTGPGVTIKNTVTLAVDDVLAIAEYNNTDGNWIPETPTKLGLYPKFTPEIFTDYTYNNPTTFIRGHDGSLTPVFGDYRDQILLELEKRIYNNIKTVYNDKLVNIFDSVPGKFRNVGLTNSDFNQIIGKNYLNWAYVNNLNYSINVSYQNDNPFSYNYSGSFDVIDGSNLPGSWRACYEYYYDCQTPNLTPWEMLGFSEEPDWWQTVYGPAPYTSGNKILWTDLQNGFVAQGERQGINNNFVRPDLLNFIPVNENGQLLPPIGVLTNLFDSNTFNRNWTSGQWSPIETAWKNSSEYAFALQIVMALNKPAQYFSYGLNTNKYTYNQELDQYLLKNTNVRLIQSQIDVNGDVGTGEILRANGYINWVGDYQIAQGAVNKSALLHFVRDYKVQLAYRMAGFTGKQYLKILAEQYSPSSTNTNVIIPDSDYDLTLHKSVPNFNARYSGMIIERVGSGFRLNGYDSENPFFTIIVPMVTGKRSVIKVLNSAVDYYEEFTNFKLNIPYGTEVQTLQQVANIICGYERFLYAQGFRFSFFDEQLGQIKNWSLSVKELLFWAQQGWAAGSVITLSPASNYLSFFNSAYTVDRISNGETGSKIIDQNFKIVPNSGYSINRENGYLWLKLLNDIDSISFASIDVVQYEHLLIFNNRTEFNDVIFDPISGQRQFKLKLIGYKTGEWNGQLSSNGFIYGPPKVDPWQMNKDYLKGDLVEYKNFYYTASANLPGSPTFNFKSWISIDKNKLKSGLLQNFSKNAQVLETFYNTDNINLESEFDKFGLSLIGFKNRSYLTDLGLNDTSQVKFYQGFIKEKGTRKSINALGSLLLNNQSNNVSVFEDWAFRVGSYGSLDTNRSLDLVLYENYTLSNPTSLQVNSDGSVIYSSLFEDKRGLYKSTVLPWSSPFLLNRTIDSNYVDDIQTAGYVNLEDVDYTIFDLNDIQNLNLDISTIGTGSVIWVAKDYNQIWNVFRVNDSTVSIVNLTNALNRRLLVTTDVSHSLVVNDTVMITNLSRFNGFYKVLAINGLTQFTIEVNSSLSGFSFSSESGTIQKLVSLKIQRQTDINSIRPETGWAVGDKVWVEEYNTNKDWAVFNKSEPWTYDSALPKSILSNNSAFGSAVKISSDNKFVVAGLPGSNGNVGAITNYAINFNDDLVENLTLTSFANDTVSLGFSIDSSSTFVVAGAPNSDSDVGYVFVYSKDQFGSITESQILHPNTVDQGKFGYSISLSEDSYWMYIGAPGTDKVYVYAFNRDRLQANTSFVADGVSNSYLLNFVPDNEESILVVSASQTFVPYKDYTLSSSQITFTIVPTAGTITVVQNKGYQYFSTLTGNTGTNFGFSLTTTPIGQTLVVGAPKANLIAGTNTYINNGELFVYDRSIENYIVQTDEQINFNVRNSISTFTRVYIDGTEQFINVDWITFGPTVIQFLIPPGVGKIVTIETNIFSLVENKTSNNAVNEQEFGYSVEICESSCELFAGAPYNSDQNLFNGKVYRLANQGKLFGNVTGTVQNPSVDSGDSLRINNFLVSFSGTSLDNIVDSINETNIPGITAANLGGYISLISTSVTAEDKLDILPAQGNVISALGLTIYNQVEVINNPSTKSYDYFGKAVKTNSSNQVLAVSSDLAATLESTTFDKTLNLNTTFDSKSTEFKEITADTGAVWIFSYLKDNRNSILNPGAFSFIQQLTPTVTGINLQTDDRFGSAIDLTDNRLIVGSKHNKRQGFNTGRVFKFNNNQNLLGWDVFRSKGPKVDIDSLLKAYTFSAKDQKIIYNLDFVDPAKGKVLGLAEQEINYKTEYDPAVYNNLSLNTLAQNNTLYWSNEQVNQVWWDLSTVRYIDYEQGSIEYRSNNWGKTFPGSSIDIYEWVESFYPPNQYVANGGVGIPKYPNNEAYVTITYVDPVSNFTTVKYYFWVKNKTTVTNAATNQRSLPVSAVASYIRDPKSSGLKYYAALRDDTLAVFNMVNETVGNDTIFHLDYASKLNSNIIHNEYALISEKGSKAEDIPDSIYNKLVDSISGIDIFGNPVPDPTLSIHTRYGTATRPRQSLVLNRDEAAKNLFLYVNSILADNIISQNYNISELNGGEPIPVSNSGEYDLLVDTLEDLEFVNILLQPIGYKVCVKNDSSVGNLWTIYIKDREVIEWQPNTFYTKGQYLYYSQRAWLVAQDYTSSAEFDSENLFTYRPRNKWNLIRVQSYYIADYWQYKDWYAPGFDNTLQPKYIIENSSKLSNLRLRTGDLVKINNNGQGNWFVIQIFPNLVQTVAIQNGTLEFTENLWNLAEYNMGFGADDFDTGRFDQNPSIETRQIIDIIRNNIFINQLGPKFVEMFFVLMNYILTEQKYIDYAFKTSFITVIQKIRGLAQPEIFSRENQNFYEQYINEVKPYRTTLREYIVDYEGSDNWNGYVSDFDLPPYYDATLKLSRSPSGEFLEDANALKLPQYRDWLFNYSYYIESIDIINGGSGYTLPPVVNITGSSNGNDAVAKAYITDGAVSRIDLLYTGSNYISTPIIVLEGGNGIGASARANLKNDLVRSFKFTMLYDRYTYSTSVRPWEPNTTYSQGQVLNYNGKAYIVNAINYVSSNTFSLRNLTEYTVDKFLTANDRIQAYYEPELGQPAKVFSLLQNGIDYPGVQVQGPLYTDSGGFDTSGFDTVIFDPFQLDSDGTVIISDAVLDSKVSSTFIDSTVGVKPEDIVIDGGPYVYAYFRNWSSNTSYQKGDLVSYNNQVYYTIVDYTSNTAFNTSNLAIYDVGPYASHAPEELVPGRVFDTLEMTIYTIAADPTSNVFVDWQANSGLAVDYIQVANVGLGYDPGNVFVTITDGGSFIQAEAQVILDSNGSAISFEMISSGAGFITTPNVNIIGVNLVPIQATAVMKLTNAPDEDQPYTLMSYKIFKDMNEKYTYLRVDSSASTTLTTNLALQDPLIYVTDASVLPEPAAAGGEPGVVFINGERIVYYYKDNITNTLGQLRRGTNGTGAKQHFVGNTVYDASQNQIVIQSDNYVWYPGIVANGTINVSAFSNTIIGTNTYFQNELTVGANIFLGDGKYVGKVNRIISNTSAQMVTAVGFYANAASFEYAANVTKVTTSGNNYTFYSNTGYIRSNVWYTGANSNVTDEQGLFNSNTIQVQFLKQGLLNSI